MLKITERYLIKAVVLSLMWGAWVFIGPCAISAEEGKKVFGKSSFVLIQFKYKDAILTSEQRFLITEQTKILDSNGKEMTIRDLPVPCKAKILYQPLTNNDPNVLKIIISQVLPRASTAWPSPVSE
jgi:hypothetical protein